MALGWCTRCNKLKTITPVAQLEGRAVDWGPIEHHVEMHVGCGAPIERVEDECTIDDGENRHVVGVMVPVCMKCGPLAEDASVESERCPGSRRPIR